MPIDKTTSEKVNNAFVGLSELSQEPGGLKRYNLFLPINDVRKLEDHFQNLGTNKSTGIRMILRQFILDNRL